MAKKQRFVIVGLGNRGRDCFGRTLLALPKIGLAGVLPEIKERAEIVAFVDVNLGRCHVANEELGTKIPVFRELGEALDRHPADWVVVTTSDNTHADICVEALEHGASVVVDKPLATSAWECDRIIQAAKKAGRQVIVGHNMRYDEHMLAVAKLVRSGAIGKVLHVEAAEVLDLDHGGSYYHRWHAEFDKSAGLMNHKGCHLLDIINWTIEDRPVGVSAMGSRSYYKSRTDIKAGPRCSQCGITAQCPHFRDIDEYDQHFRKMYVNVEKEDGYICDACVFSDRNTINDHEILNIRYAGGILATFSLVTFAPREYTYYYYTGTEGRIEFSVVYEPGEVKSSGVDFAEGGVFKASGKPQVRVFKKDGSVEFVPVKKHHSNFGHGGADVKLVAHILGMSIEGVDPIQRATPEQARDSVVIADMAARSVAGKGRYVGIEETGRDFPPRPPVI